MIYIVTHKPVEIPRLEGYQPIQVGSAAEAFPGCVRDDTGDNIADKNASFCELTALYWAWRNTGDDYKGLVHYRRYFGRRPLSSDRRDILSFDELKAVLNGCDIVLAKPATYHVSVRDQLLMDCCTPETLDRLDAAMAALHPESLPAYNAVFAGNRVSQYNMLFCRGGLYDEYCAWLFPVLFRLEGEIDLTGVGDYQRRLYGFLSERLLNVWALHRRLKVKYAPVVSTEYTARDHLTYLRRDITNGLRFRLGQRR